MASSSSDIKADDHIQDMKQVVEIMNQVYKNVYAIYENNRANRTFGWEYIGIEVFIEKEMIGFNMAVPDDVVENFEKLISSFYAGAIIDIIQQPKFLEAWKYMEGWDIKLAHSTVAPIKTYESFWVDPMDSLLSAYSRVWPDEKMCLQILLAPINKDMYEEMRKDVDWYKKCKKAWYKCMRSDFLKKFSDNEDEWKWEEENKYDFSQQQLQDLDKKVEDELFEVNIRIFASSPESHRPQKIIADLTRSFHQYNNIGLNYFVYEKAENIHSFAKNLVLRSFFSEWTLSEKIAAWKNPMILNIKELSSIVHFPHSRYNLNPRIRRQKYKIVPAPDNVPTEWLLLWYNTYWWVKKAIYAKHMDRFRHFYTIWQTWTWKSTMMLAMAQQDLSLGNGLCLIDPHGDLCEHILKHIPKERIEDLIYFDFANTDYPIAFNPFEAETPDERDIVTNDMVEMFENMYGKEIFWPRIQDYFRNAVMLLMEQPDWWTLPEIMRLFTDEAYLDAKLKNLTDPVIQARWNKTYKSMWDREKQEMIPFFQAKFGSFTTWVYVRNVIGQPRSAFHFWRAMQEKKIILCNLSKWLTWEINSQLIWRMFSIQIKLHALKRAAIEEDARVPFFLYVDEFQNYVSQSFESILSEARKYRLWLSIAHQYIEQLKQSWLGGSMDLSKPIFGNIGSQLYLKVWPEDAEFLEKNVSPEFSKTDLLGMDRFKWIMTLSIDTQPSRPFTLTCTNPFAIPVVNSPEKVNIIKQISSLKRGTKRELAEKELYYRVGV